MLDKQNIYTNCPSMYEIEKSMVLHEGDAVCGGSVDIFFCLLPNGLPWPKQKIFCDPIFPPKEYNRTFLMFNLCDSLFLVQVKVWKEIKQI